jgi:hypothetical protein
MNTYFVLAIVTTCPWFALAMSGRNSLIIRKCANVLTLKMRWGWSSVWLRIGRKILIPALLITTVGEP